MVTRKLKLATIGAGGLIAISLPVAVVVACGYATNSTDDNIAGWPVYDAVGAYGWVFITVNGWTIEIIEQSTGNVIDQVGHRVVYYLRYTLKDGWDYPWANFNDPDAYDPNSDSFTLVSPGVFESSLQVMDIMPASLTRDLVAGYDVNSRGGDVEQTLLGWDIDVHLANNDTLVPEGTTLSSGTRYYLVFTAQNSYASTLRVNVDGTFTRLEDGEYHTYQSANFIIT